MRTLALVHVEMAAQMKEFQAVEGVDERYMFTTRLIDVPNEATPRISRRLRAVVAIAGAGVMSLWVAHALRCSLARARESRPNSSRPKRRSSSGRHAAPEEPAPAASDPDPSTGQEVARAGSALRR